MSGKARREIGVISHQRDVEDAERERERERERDRECERV